MSDQPLKLAVVTGGHPFDVPGFHDLLRAVCGDSVVPYVQHLDELATSSESVLRGYDAALFYFFPLQGPVDEGQPWQAGRPRSALTSLLDAGKGLIILHHALLAYPDWEVWDEVVGTTGRARFSYHPARRLEVAIAEPTHEITAGMSGWRMIDETYRMPEPVGAPLLTVEHEESMRTIAWARNYRASRVVCIQSGHDATAWTVPGFQQLLARGIRWSVAKERVPA